VTVQAAPAGRAAGQRLRVTLALRGDTVARSESACGARACTTVLSLDA
jgi:hypothetical protein